jgi:outer membrane protein
LLNGFGQGALARLRDARLDSDAQEIQWRRQVENAVIDITSAYWGLLSARESAAIAARGVELSAQQLSETMERKEAGFAGSGDVLQVRVSLGQARRSALQAEAAVGAAELRLARLLGMPLAEGAGIELTDVPEVPAALPTVASVLAEASQGNADVVLARIDFERAKRSARRGANGALPDLSLNASAGSSAGGTDPSAVRSALWAGGAPSVGVGLSIGLPLIPRENLAAAGMARLAFEQAELALEAAEQDLVLRVNDVARDVARDAGGLDAARETLSYAVESLAAQRELLAEGRGSTRDVVDSIEALRSAELSELNARIALQSSVMRARQVAGTLVRTTEL